jgi:hypothetical protein
LPIIHSIDRLPLSLSSSSSPPVIHHSSIACPILISLDCPVSALVFLFTLPFISSSLFPPLKLTGYQWFHSPILPLSAWGFILSAHSPFAAWLRLETIPSSPSIIPGIHHHHHTTWKLPFFQLSFLSCTPPCGPVQYPFFTPLPFSLFPDFHSPRGPQLCICFLVIIILYYSLFVFLLSLSGWPCPRPNR